MEEPAIKTEDTDWPMYIKAALTATPFMALATHGPAGPWASPVHFAYDTDLNFYFLSQPKSRHMGNLKLHTEVALAVYSTDQPPVGSVMGLQVSGAAEILDDADVPAAHQIYYSRPEFSTVKAEPSAYQGASAPWKFVKIIPNEIGYFNSSRFEQRQVVPPGVHL